MIPELREQFNANFTEEKHQRFLQSLDAAVGMKIEFRPCETPIFLPTDLLAEMQQSAKEIITQLCTPEYFTASARAIPAEDDEVDDLYNQVYRELITYIMKDPHNMDQATYLTWAAHNLERTADRVGNICERVIFTVTGEVIEFSMPMEMA